jgi:nidogen (entactin)
MWKLNLVIFSLALICACEALTRDDLFEYNNEPSEILPRGDEQFEFVKLNTPVHFYSDTYDHIYVSVCLLKVKVAYH